MGSLKINRVSYFGNEYYYESPKLENGINIIVGDNGSGKSTFSFFLDYGLGGNVEHFKKNKDPNSKSKKKKKVREYSLIVNDKDNFVLLEVSINGISYKFKRFINTNEIFINDGEDSFSKKLYRQGDADIFSDWLLSKLDIEVFDLSLGRHNWLIGFKDLYRLMYYDQETSPIKVFKSPDTDNFISDSDVIRKAIFETLLGKTSETYNQSYSTYRKAKLEYEQLNNELSEFCKLNNVSPDCEYDLEEANQEIEELIRTIEDIENERELAACSKTEFGNNLELIENLKQKYLQKSIELNQYKMDKDRLVVEMSRIDNFKQDLECEIKQINKIIFTHDKLSIFSTTTCPFCSKEIDEDREKLCLCGHEKDEENTTKFVYSSSDYLHIYAQKNKKLATIEDAIRAVRKDVLENTMRINQVSSEIETIETKLSHLVNISTHEGNLVSLSELNSRLNLLNDDLYLKKRECLTYKEFNKLDIEKELKKGARDKADKELKRQEYIFNNANKTTIKEFGKILKSLVDESSLSCETMSMDSGYMPLVDGGIYREKSSAVTIRMMYYFTMLSYSLANPSVKFPRFLVMDTPEDSGIDKEKLIKNIGLLEGKLEEYNSLDADYQVILTTGDDRYPPSYQGYVKDTFEEAKDNYILRPRN
ncbi:AAA family ATPase [Vibrio splendidus]